jgi:hypothetical protein
MRPLIELLGWYGAAAILAAYVLVSFAVLQPDGLTYQLLNGTGAVGIVIVSLHKRNYQPAALNAVWAVVAVVAIATVF